MLQLPQHTTAGTDVGTVGGAVFAVLVAAAVLHSSGCVEHYKLLGSAY